MVVTFISLILLFSPEVEVYHKYVFLLLLLLLLSVLSTQCVSRRAYNFGVIHDSVSNFP